MVILEKALHTFAFLGLFIYEILKNYIYDSMDIKLN